jgi:hypothetical protein
MKPGPYPGSIFDWITTERKPLRRVGLRTRYVPQPWEPPVGLSQLIIGFNGDVTVAEASSPEFVSIESVIR